MNVKNIFQRNPTDEVRVPEIEVQGDKMRVPESGAEEPDSGESSDPPQQSRKTREYQLPKTKWFA